MKELLNKYLTIRNRNIIAIVVIILGIGFIVNYSFFEPTYINEYIATKVYGEPANSYFDDENFYKCVVDSYNEENGTSIAYTESLSDEQLSAIKKLSCRGDGGKTDNEKIVSTNGLEKLIGLEKIDFSHNKITEIDLSRLLYLKTFISYSNNISNIDIAKNVNLVEFYLTNSSISQLDVSKNKLLENLNLDHNLIENIDVSNNVNLKSLSIRYNDLAEIDISKNTDLVYLCLGNYDILQKLDLSSNLNLETLYLYGTGQMKELDLSNNIKLKTLSIQDSNSITSLDLKNNLNISGVIFQSTNLKKIDLSGLPVKSAYIAFNTKLENLILFDTELSSLHLNSWPGQSILSKLDISNCNLKSLNVSSETALKELYVSSNQLTELDVSKNINLEYLNASDNPINNVDLSGCINLKYLTLGNKTGEEDKTLINIDLSNNTALLGLSLSGNSINELDLSNLSKLNTLCLGGVICKWTSSSSSVGGFSYGNKLKTLDLSNNSQLTRLYVSYNKLNNLVIDNNVELNTLDISRNQLTEIDLSNNTKLIELSIKENQLSEIYLSNNDKLIDLDLSNNKLTKIDLSNNILLNNPFIYNNPFGERLYVYKGDNTIVGNNVKIPSQLGWDNPIWTSSDDNIAIVNNVGIVNTLKSGRVDIIGVSKKIYTGGYKKYYETTSTINVVEITSDKYTIDEENGYILLGSDNDVENIKSNINVSHDDVDIDIENYKLYVKYDDEILKEFNIIGFSSEKYDLNNKYIYIGNNELDLTNIKTVNCDKEISDNKLIIKFGEEVIKEYYLISLSSEKYDLSKDYIYTGNTEFNLDDINIVGCHKEVIDNKLIIKFNDEILDEYVLVSVSSEVHDINNDYIYIGTKDINLNDINVINGTAKLDDNKLVVSYGDEPIKEYLIYNIKFNSYNTYDNKIVVMDELSYSNFINDIKVSDGITYKLYNDEEEVISGNIEKDMVLKIYYEDNVIDEYIITDKNEYLEFDDSLDIDIDNCIINKIKHGTKIEDIKNMINTSGQVSILDKNGNVIEDTSNKNIGTGYKFKIDMSSNIFEYVVSVRGDITGEGDINVNDVVGVSRHVIKGNYLEGIEYINASDINSDNKVDINDVIRLAKYIINGSEL